MGSVDFVVHGVGEGRQSLDAVHKLASHVGDLLDVALAPEASIGADVAALDFDEPAVGRVDVAECHQGGAEGLGEGLQVLRFEQELFADLAFGRSRRTPAPLLLVATPILDESDLTRGADLTSVLPSDVLGVWLTHRGPPTVCGGNSIETETPRGHGSVWAPYDGCLGRGTPPPERKRPDSRLEWRLGYGDGLGVRNSPP